MKIVCDSCGTRYSVSDEKVRGKIFKIRCKKCGETIVVRGTDEVPTAVDPRTASCWHVVMEGQQQGPYTAAQVAELVLDGRLTEQSHCWREGFADWKRLHEVDLLMAAVAALQKERSEPAPAEGSQAAQSEDAAAGEAGGGEEFQGFTAPDSSTAPPDSAGEALSDMFGVGAGGAGEEAAKAGTEEAARTESRGAGTDLFAGAAGSDEGGDLFGDGGGGGLFPDEPASGGSGASVLTPPSMTGARNETSVLFSLSNLQALGTGSAGGSTESPSSKGSALSSSSASGLIDIKAMASALQTSPESETKEDVDSLMAVGGEAFGTGLGAPVLAPRPATESTNALLYAIIGVGVAVVIAIVVLVVVLVTADEDEGTPAAGGNQPPVLALGAQGQGTGASQPAPQGSNANTPPNAQPTKNASSGETTSGGPAPVPITDDDGSEGQEETEASRQATKNASRRQGRRDDGQRSSEPERQAEKAPATEAAAHANEAPADETKARRATSALEALLDDAVGGGSSHHSSSSSGSSSGGSSDDSASAGLPRTLSRAQVQAGMNRVAARVRRCGNGQSGTVTVNVVISGSSGRVTSANVTGNFAGTPVGSCAARAVRGARFPRFAQPSLTVRYPFRVQ